ncbi:MAG: response regulator [Dehalococcoidia bacterium]
MAIIDRGRPLRVLAVEDDADLRDFYGTILREEGHQVRLARNGLEALHHLDWAPDLILLDMMMPVMDGYEFLRRLRASPKGAHVPVLVLSAALPPGRATLHGAQAVLRKPFDFDRLLRTIEMYGHRPRAGAN